MQMQKWTTNNAKSEGNRRQHWRKVTNVDAETISDLLSVKKCAENNKVFSSADQSSLVSFIIKHISDVFILLSKTHMFYTFCKSLNVDY